MKKYCGKCGSKLDENTGLCPNCNLRPSSEKKQEDIESEEQLSKKDVRKKDKKRAKRAKKKEKLAKLSVGQKVLRFFRKLFVCVILLVVLVGGVIGSLSYFGIIDISFLQDFDKNNLLEVVSKKTIVIEEKDIIMKTDTEGTATIIVQMPDYEQLFKEASASENPDRYLLKALALGKYDIQKYEENAAVIIDNGVTIIHSDEVVHQLLEKELVDAINALSEVEK